MSQVNSLRPRPDLENPKEFITLSSLTKNGNQYTANGEGGDMFISINEVVSGSLSITNFRNAVILACHFKWPESGDPNTRSGTFSISDCKGTAHFEGCLADMNRSAGDCFRVNASPTGTIVIQNCRALNPGYANPGTHGDLIHCQGGPTASLYVENFTGYTCGQGFQLPFQNNGKVGVRKLEIKNCTIGFAPKEGVPIARNDLRLWNIGQDPCASTPYGDDCLPPDGTILKNFYIDYRGASKKSVAANCSYKINFDVVSEDQINYTSPKITGSINYGTTDFAPENKVGLNYQRSYFEGTVISLTSLGAGPASDAITVIGQSDPIRKTIPYTLPWDDMPVDLSFVYAKEKPAGKHGFMKVDGDKFVFEDGTPARFWGTCFNSAQCFPSHEHSEKLARRLGKIGVNIVRFHQMDAEWSTPNIFQFTKGEYKPNTLSFDPVSIDRLDYLIYRLKQEGVYIHIDLLTYRKFKEGDGIEDAQLLDDSAKPFSTYNKKLIELQKRFNYEIWTHNNPYTGLAYKDDPAIVLVEVTNESDLFTQKVTLEPYRTELEDRYREWAEGKKIKLPKDKVDFTKTDKTLLEFFIVVTQDYYKEMIRHMRETGVKIPITGTNWSRGVAHLASQVETDYTDSHAYTTGGGGWRDINGKFGNQPNMGSTNNMLPQLAFNRVSGKPFFVSEWDNAWPNEWRAESSLLMASVGSLQGWGGFAIHTYRYTLDEDVDMIGKPITSESIGGRAYRGGVFDTFNDPAKFGLFYHAALITRRGDVKPSGKTIVIKADDITSGSNIKALLLTPEQNRVEMVVPGVTARGETVSPDKELVDVEVGEVMSDTKELYRNLKKRIGWIDSPRTKAVYGFVGKEGIITLTNMKVNVKTDFATVAVSSLTDASIKSSDNMLLTAVGRADNTNSKYNADRTVQLDPGHGPIQVEIIEALIEIETDKKNLRVFSINPQGFIIGYIPAQYENGVLKFEIGKEHQSMYYLIQSL